MFATFLDTSTANLPANERERLADAPVRVVIEHDYGAFVHVPLDDDTWPETRDSLFDAGYPGLVEVLAYARSHEAWWINFDTDAEEHEGLPTYS